MALVTVVNFSVDRLAYIPALKQALNSTAQQQQQQLLQCKLSWTLSSSSFLPDQFTLLYFVCCVLCASFALFSTHTLPLIA
ncbi:hypothetical protein BP00DRAFT_429501 [Aspergillus indologenus CBS 114.80]|uniref:Uncharacterized protein n=1 Tax=Aspergillus indologenus CBS 114.80 TaxID=1450541 RepID=A0A2V5HX71_9EURO|nr:hypothetical protein BP00DRAFT_429501 [Aspergillus indologenus CBS 114.80]